MGEISGTKTSKLVQLSPHKRYTIEPALRFSLFTSKTAKYDETDLLESLFSECNNF